MSTVASNPSSPQMSKAASEKVTTHFPPKVPPPPPLGPSLATAQYSARSVADISTITYSATHHNPFLKTFHKSSTKVPTFMLPLSIFQNIEDVFQFF